MIFILLFFAQKMILDGSRLALSSGTLRLAIKTEAMKRIQHRKKAPRQCR